MNEQMNIEQKISKEEGQGPSAEAATRNANECHPRTYLKDLEQSLYSSGVFLRLFAAILLVPSAFLVRHSSVPEAVGGTVWSTASSR